MKELKMIRHHHVLIAFAKIIEIQDTVFYCKYHKCYKDTKIITNCSSQQPIGD